MIDTADLSKQPKGKDKVKKGSEVKIKDLSHLRSFCTGSSTQATWWLHLGAPFGAGE